MPTKQNKLQSKARKPAKQSREFFGTFRPDEDLEQIVDSEGCIRGQACENFSRETGLPIAA